ncbi:MAG: hypothetical protein WKF83_01865 [Nocardioidaceae bacterium]
MSTTPSRVRLGKQLQLDHRGSDPSPPHDRPRLRQRARSGQRATTIPVNAFACTGYYNYFTPRLRR